MSEILLLVKETYLQMSNSDNIGFWDAENPYFKQYHELLPQLSTEEHEELMLWLLSSDKQTTNRSKNT
jgi:hypothetical protein